MVQSSVGYCRCGQEIYLEYLLKGNSWFVRFTTSEGYEIKLCPGCGRKLEEDELESL